MARLRFKLLSITPVVVWGRDFPSCQSAKRILQISRLVYTNYLPCSLIIAALDAAVPWNSYQWNTHTLQPILYRDLAGSIKEGHTLIHIQRCRCWGKDSLVCLLKQTQAAIRTGKQEARAEETH